MTHDMATPRRRLRTGETIAALGVIGSLIFVGLEVRQNTSATEGATLQAISDTHTTLLLESVWDQDFIGIFRRVLLLGALQADLTPDENMRMGRYYIAFLSHLENTFLQHRAGVVSDDVFESYGWRNRLWVTPHFLARADVVLSVAVSPEFAEFFRSRTSDLVPWTPAPQPTG